MRNMNYLRKLAHKLKKDLETHITASLRYHTVYHARLDAVDTGQIKPATVYREDLDTSVETYVTQRIVDLWTTGQLAIGETVLLAFSDGDPDKAIILNKIYTSWP